MAASPNRDAESAGRYLRSAFGIAALLLSVLTCVRGVSQEASGEAREASGGELSEAAPSNTLVYLWSRPENAVALRESLAPFQRALAESGIVDAYLRELSAGVEEESRADFVRNAAHWRKLFARVDWWGLVRRELLFCGRISPAGRFESLLLCRVDRNRRDRQLEALRALLYGLAAIGTNLELDVADRDGVPTTVLYNRLDYAEQITIGGRDDLIGISTSASFLRQSLALLDRRGRDFGFRASPSFREARARLARCRPVVDAAETGASDGQAGGTPILECIVSPGPVFAEVPELDALESWHLRVSAKGRTLAYRQFVLLRDNDKHLLHPVLQKQKPITDLLSELPVDARRFSLSAGFDPRSAVESALRFASLWSTSAFFVEDARADLDALGLDEEALEGFSGRRLSLEVSSEKGVLGRLLWLELADGDAARGRAADTLEKLEKALAEWGGRVSDVAPLAGGERVRRVALPLIGAEVFVGRLEDGVAIATTEPAMRRFAANKKTSKGRDAPAWLPVATAIDSVVDGYSADWVEAIRLGVRVSGLLGTLVPDADGSSLLRPVLLSLPLLENSIRTLDIFDTIRAYSRRQGREMLGAGQVVLRARARSF